MYNNVINSDTLGQLTVNGSARQAMSWRSYSHPAKTIQGQVRSAANLNDFRRPTWSKFDNVTYATFIRPHYLRRSTTTACLSRLALDGSPAQRVRASHGSHGRRE